MNAWGRTIAIFGGAAILALIGVLLALHHLIIGVAWIIFVLMVAIVIGMGRFGPDRVPLEIWVLRRWRYSRSVRRYTYAQGKPTSRSQPIQPEAQPKPSPLTPMSWEPDSSTAYGVIGFLLAVVGTGFFVWLANGGDATIGQDLLSIFGLWR